MFKHLELFAGAGGLALGFEKAGFRTKACIDIDKHAANTIRINRPAWKVLHTDVANVDFRKWKNKVDVISGGFPCQTFSTAGKRRGLKDVRGTLFYELARAAKETNAKIIVGENVKGLLIHDKGRTLETIKYALHSIGYLVKDIMVLDASQYKVAQERPRLFIIAVRKDLIVNIEKPRPAKKVVTLRDIFYSGRYYTDNVSELESDRVNYSKRKKKYVKKIPEGCNHKVLSDKNLLKYAGENTFNSIRVKKTGGCASLLRRAHYDKPAKTILTSPQSRMVDNIHPTKHRPFTVRESARIQSFPDCWTFSGGVANQYKQIGNAVPVNLAYAVAKQVRKGLENIKIKPNLSDELKELKTVLKRLNTR